MEDPTLTRWNMSGFRAFETTGFVTALLVSAYSFIPDPTGTATEGVSEIRTFCYWRRTMLVIGAGLLFKAAVVVLQAVRGRRLRTIGWLLGLMLAPWAHFANSVVAAVAANTAVRNLMINRMARHELSVVLREFLLFGHHSLTIVPVTKWLCGDMWNLPITVLEELCEEGSIARESIYGNLHRQASEDLPMWLVAERAWRHGPHSPARNQGFARLRRQLDVWRRRWSPHNQIVKVDPFPAGIFSSPTEGPSPSTTISFSAPTAEEPSRRSPPPDELDRRMFVLDEIEVHREGYTLSEARCARSLPPTVCDLCKMAIRGAVEAFLESSVRAHAVMQAGAWLDTVTMGWGTSMEPVMDTLWVAVFVDHTAHRVEDGDRHGGEISTDAVVGVNARTKQFLLHLFLVARSLLGQCPQLTSALRYISAQLHSWSWWESYWRRIIDVVQTKEIRRAKKVVLWQLRNEDLVAVLYCLVDRPVSPGAFAKVSLCGNGNCFLDSDADVVVAWRIDPLPRPPRLPDTTASPIPESPVAESS